MVAGVIRLSAVGKEDLYLTYRPQITFFKAIYKRNTFFAMENIDQNFVTPPQFGGRYSCILSPHGELISDLILRIQLPTITSLPNSLLSRWVDSVACAMIKKIEFEINGSVIDTLSGDWIRVWFELAGHNKRNSPGSHKRGLYTMIGSDKTRPFSLSQSSRTLYLPIPFWFCKSSGQAFPVAAINNHEVRVNVEFQKISTVLQYGPVASIKVAESSVHFSSGDMIFQGTMDPSGAGASATGIYFSFDATTSLLYYNPVLGSFTGSAQDVYTRLLDPTKYLIWNANGVFCCPVQTSPTIIQQDLSWLLQQRYTLVGATVMAQYVFLSNPEKKYFDQRRHDYVIEQLQEYSLQGIQAKSNIPLQFRRPCCELVWVARLLNTCSGTGLPYNFIQPNGSPLLGNLSVTIATETLFDDPDGKFYGPLQMWSHHQPCPKGRLPGIFLYSFALRPGDPQPSGSINMSKIEKSALNVQVPANINNDVIGINIFARTYNVLVIQNGVAELLF